MANITLSSDDDDTARARAAAQMMGTSLNQLVRDYIAQLGGAGQRAVEADEYLRESGRGNSGGWTFDREALQRNA
ncbi:MAG TPA: MerR family transcriptional regulator [Casimicrobium sp.]|mgnify:CR=1 FL=1|nr:MerR family transcriptional regulator [Casimicrobium sp.]